MDRLPPRIVRRIVLAPLAFLLALLIVASSPLLLAVAIIADVFVPGNWRTVRIVSFVLAYAALEVVSLVALFTLWIASGFGATMRGPRMQEAHYGLMRWWLGVVDRVARRTFHLRIFIEDRPTPRPGPILVFSRHAGPGNSLLLVGTILVGYRREPRIVMLAKLQWEPLFDTMLNRLPNRFIKHDPKARDRSLKAISELATNLGDQGAFVLFPEGKDFTPRVRTRAIKYLQGKGHRAAAERAERMSHVLPPRQNGVIAALETATEADVVFVAHTVLEDIGTFKELWARIPLAEPIHARYWRLPPDQVPRQQDEVIEWLYGWWERIDAWIDERSGPTMKEESTP